MCQAGLAANNATVLVIVRWRRRPDLDLNGLCGLGGPMQAGGGSGRKRLFSLTSALLFVSFLLKFGLGLSFVRASAQCVNWGRCIVLGFSTLFSSFVLLPAALQVVCVPSYY